MILEYYITCYRGQHRSGAATACCQWAGTQLGPGAWLPCLPAAAAAAAGVEPAGPREDRGRLEDAEEEGGRCRRGRE